ncbi:hypothetical protein JHK87_033701 [Glycine soja]|nr:hypothetical protein JHK87_033701 [Glycine soja]
MEKRKQLYLAIKRELDEPTQRTYDGDGLYWKAEENDIQMEKQKKELQEKEETIKVLKTQLLSMEKEKKNKQANTSRGKKNFVQNCNRLSHRDDKVDCLIVKWDDELVNIPTYGEAKWRANGEERQVVMERTNETNSVTVTISGLVELDIHFFQLDRTCTKVHNYQLPTDYSFSHLETQLWFKKSIDNFEGVLGQTYRPGYVSPVKRGVNEPAVSIDGHENVPVNNEAPLLKAVAHQPVSIASEEFTSNSIQR